MSATVTNPDYCLSTAEEPSLSDRIRAGIDSGGQFSLSLGLIADGLDRGIINDATAKHHIDTIGKLALALDEC